MSVPDVLLEREEIIAIVFGVVLFTLLVQGLTTKPLLEKLGLLSNQQLRQQYLEAIAHRVALNRVLTHLSQVSSRHEIEPEIYHHLVSHVQEQLDCLKEEINQFYNQSPQLRDLATDQLEGDLLAIEADTYAEFVRSGQLNELPLSLLPNIFKDRKGKIIS